MNAELHLPLWSYAAVGAAILWVKMKKAQRDVYALTDIIKEFIPYPKIRAPLEILVYLSIGSLVSIGVFDPSTPAQAIAAGLGWTSLTTK